MPDAIVKTLMTDDGILLNNYTGMKFSINVFHILYIDPALPVAFEQEFVDIRHLLCIWHVDRYHNSYGRQLFYYHAIYRAWQRKL